MFFKQFGANVLLINYIGIFLGRNFIVSNEISFSMIKEIDNYIYIGGKSYLARYKLEANKMVFDKEMRYDWDVNIMNGSDIGLPFHLQRWPRNFTRNPTSLAFDTCLNWKQEHPDPSVRTTAFDFQHMNYHTPSGDFVTMSYTCKNSFIRSVEPLDEETLWVCGTFGAFPRAFSVWKSNLEFKQFVDVNMMSCARYVDEPMATYRDRDNNLYVASGWGLYRPDKKDPDIPDNNSTMLYADWRLWRNLFTLPAALTWVLSSDVNFINVVKETNDHLYFFGHEINNQYGLNNQDDRNAWQSFMLRICKKDIGFKYIPVENRKNLKEYTAINYYAGKFGEYDYVVFPNHDLTDYNKTWYDDYAHLPKTHFVSSLKINFGCYIGKRPRAISDNHFWGDTNVVYLNKLADVIYDPERKIRFRTKQEKESFGCKNLPHHQIPLIGLFNKEGLSGTSLTPTGALCQLQINANIFNEIGSKEEQYQKSNAMSVKNAFEEAMAMSSTSWSSVYSRTLHRTYGYTLNPFWNQGVMIGDNNQVDYYQDAFNNVGKCNDNSFYKNMNLKAFLRLQNFSNTAWPNELPNRISSTLSSACQYSSAELYSFNATFIIPGVEFKKMFLVRDNIVDYAMHEIANRNDWEDRRKTSPLMIFVIISTSGQFYRVVLCDFDNAMLNHGEDKTSDAWYNWCIFRHTDQPYLYRQYAPMEKKERGKSFLYRASSLLEEKRIISDKETSSYPINQDPQFHAVKDVLQKGNYLHILTTNEIRRENLHIDCSNYATCISCASDPECMWEQPKSKGKCRRYNEKSYKSGNYLQDVLDRGFRCIELIKDNEKPISYPMDVIFQDANYLTFPCKNAGWWRGPIEWRINDMVIVHDSLRYLINDEGKYLTVIKLPSNVITINCYGVRKDHDKLFGEVDYKWVRSKYDMVLLTSYVNKNKTLNESQTTHGRLLSSGVMSRASLTAFVIIMIVISLLIGLFVGAIYFYKRFVRKPVSLSKDYNRNNPESEACI